MAAGATSEDFVSGKVTGATASVKSTIHMIRGRMEGLLASPETADRVEQFTKKSLAKGRAAASQISSFVSVRDTSGDEGNRNRAVQLVTAAGKIITQAVAAGKALFTNIAKFFNNTPNHKQTNSRSGPQFGEIVDKARHGALGGHDKTILARGLPHAARREVDKVADHLRHRHHGGGASVHPHGSHVDVAKHRGGKGGHGIG